MRSILVIRNVTKRYPGVIALDDIEFALEESEVRALVGKNGAGKSTLVKILSGAVHPDRGDIFIDELRVAINHPRDAFEQGISTVYQEMSLVPGLSVAENILLGRWPKKRQLGVPTIDIAQVRDVAQASIDRLNVKLDINTLVLNLSIAEQQLVEIAKAISFDPRVLILDEPTSALPIEEVKIVHSVVRRLAEQGHSIIYVTHRLQEIPQVADSVTVLRDGRHIGTIEVDEATPARIANMMIGEDWEIGKARRESKRGDLKLAVKNLNREGFLNDISFEIRRGEILGIAGLLGSGRTELVRAIFGLDPVDSGEIVVNGETVTHPSPKRMKSRGVGMTPEDRKLQGFVSIFPVQRNLTLASLNRISRRGILQKQREKTLAQKMVDDIDIVTPNLQMVTGNLSGGNQQKVVIGNWLNTLPEVLIMDEPTRGIDIHAKEQIFRLVYDLAEQGLAILFISSEIEEVLNVSDRILVMNRGRVTGEVKPGDVDLERLMGLVMEEIEDV
jgi:ribose transport system ATP-binding protein